MQQQPARIIVLQPSLSKTKQLWDQKYRVPFFCIRKQCQRYNYNFFWGPNIVQDELGKIILISIPSHNYGVQIENFVHSKMSFTVYEIENCVQR